MVTYTERLGGIVSTYDL